MMNYESILEYRHRAVARSNPFHKIGAAHTNKTVNFTTKQQPIAHTCCNTAFTESSMSVRAKWPCVIVTRATGTKNGKL
jgi:hypothetical protein